MIISGNLLSKYLKIPSDIKNITENHITEVSKYHEGLKIDNVVTGYVESCVKHPNSDHLHITKVNVGDGEILDIVCGASNVSSNQYVIVAKVGAVLPGNFKIKPVKIRGIESNGMICSLKELGFDLIPEKYANGIFNFPKPMPLGIDFANALNYDDLFLELEITPNRGDLLSIVGYAKDLAAMTGQQVKLPIHNIKENGISNPIKVKINTDKCYEYHARYAEVEVKESPWWLQAELIKRGHEPHNNVVDISNLVLYEYGTPLHIFDASKFGKNEVVIYEANISEKVCALNQEEYIIEKGDIVITDGTKPTAIAGIKGLSNTMVTNETRKIIIEAANFSPSQIRKTAKRLNLSSDAQIRFERGVCPDMIKKGLEYATFLLQMYANASVYSGISSDKTKEFYDRLFKITPEYVNSLLGVDLNINDLYNIFSQYGFKTTILESQELEVIVPNRRLDINSKIDLVEEVGRVYGYNNIEPKLLVDSLNGDIFSRDKKYNYIRNLLSNIGFNEVITYSLIREDELNLFNDPSDAEKVLKPLTDERTHLRQSLINGLINTYKYNKARKHENINLFEIGKVFNKGSEKTNLACLLSGSLIYNSWQNKPKTPDFYDIKGVLELITDKLGVTYDLFETNKFDHYHPYIQGYILNKNKKIGTIGKLNQGKYDDNIYVFEISLEYLTNFEINNKFNNFSKFPSIKRDIAFTISKDIHIDKIIKLIKQTGGKNLIKLELFDVYEGKDIKDNERSLAFHLIFNDINETLKNEAVDKIIKKIINRLERELKAKLR